MVSKLDSDLWDTVGGKRLVDFRAGKTQLVLFDQSNKTGAIDMKMDESVLEEKWYFKMVRLTFSSKLDWGSYIISIAKTQRKFEPWFILWSFFLQRLFCMSINLPYANAWNIAVMSWLVLLIATWNCWISKQKQICGTFNHSLAASIEPLAHCWNVTSLSLCHRYCFGRC